MAPKPLSDADVALLNTQGAICVREVFDDASLALLRCGIDRNLEQPSQNVVHFEGKDGSGAYKGDYWSWKWIPEYIQFVKESGLVEIAAQVLDAQHVYFLEDNYFIKEPGCRLPTPWHQDFPYFEVDGDFLSAWVPLTPHTKDESLMMIAGSHSWGKVFMPADFDTESGQASEIEMPTGYEQMPEFDPNSDDFEILSWAVEPGDCILFFAKTVHGSKGNDSDRIKTRFSCRFFDDSARYAHEDYPWSNFNSINIERGQRLADDPENFPLVWQI